ncbi:MAG: response regulator [Chloroflexi bacterium]|nr:MAG: response regulator [Chloroflexota bacterium]
MKEEKKDILVVDDDPDFQRVVKRILEAKGYRVETVPSAREALSKARSRSYNVAILDVRLPDIEGTELLSRLLGLHPKMIAIVLTGHASVQSAIQSFNRGAFAYLEKPLDPRQLLALLTGAGKITAEPLKIRAN